jgi:nitrogen regulatory protein PII
MEGDAREAYHCSDQAVQARGGARGAHLHRGARHDGDRDQGVRRTVGPHGDLADQVVQTIAVTAKTDKIGDGKIFVLDVESAMRVRTGETNEDAL